MKRILFVLVVLFASMIGGNVFASYNEPYIHIEKATIGGYASGRDGIQSFASTQDIVLTAMGNNVDGNVSVDVFKADMDDVLKYLVYRDEGKQINTDISTNDEDIVATMSVQLKDKFTLPVEGNGVWLVHVKVDEVETFMYVIRSKYGTVVKEEKDGLLVWIQDFDSGKSLKNVPVSVYSLRNKVKKRTESKTDDEGIIHMDTSAKYDVMIVGDENKALVPLNLEYLNIGYKNDENRYQGQKEVARNFIFTDRPIYKPGDKVFFKMISRIDGDETYHVMSGKWKARIVKGWGDEQEIIAENEYDMDSFGSISGEFMLPADLKTGEYYRLEVSNDKYNKGGFYDWFSGSYRVNLQVEHYRKPEYEINVIMDNHEYINKENITFEVDGNYFSGEKLTGGTIEYTIKERNFWDSVYIDDFLNNPHQYSYGYGYGREVQKGTVQLDENGHVEVSVPTAITDGKSKIYTVEVSYKPVTGEPVIDQENVLVYAGEYGIFRSDYQYSFSVNENAKIKLVLQGNVSSANVSGRTVDISGVHTWWEVVDNDARYRKYVRKEEDVTTKTIVANNDGQAQFEFTPRKSGSYKFTATSIDQFGNAIIKEFSIWVRDKDNFVPEQNNGLSLSLDKGEYNPQDSAIATITSQTTNRDVLFDIERDFVHDYQVVHLDSNVKDVTINLKDEYIPNMQVSVVSFASDRLDEAQKQMKISAQSKKLDITLSTNKQEYGPGGEVTVDIIAKDEKGNPQKADVTVWAIDKALLELTNPGNYDIYNAYWNNRPGYTSTTNSLRGIWVNMAESGGCFVEGTKVLMGDETTKNIEDVNVGDVVSTFAQDGSGELITARVLKTHSATVNGYLTINNTLKVTDNHIVWVNNTWKRAGDVRIGDKMRDGNGKEIIVKSMQWHSDKKQVYNLIVEGVHTYIAQGYFVHNGKDGGERSIFKDTAYWNPRVRTGNDGKAKITFKLSDDLTTWVISAVGATKETIVGNTATEIHTTKPVVIRPQVPNILRVGDKVVLAASAHNNTDKDRTFIAKLETVGGDVKNASQEIKIGSGESRIVMWSISPKYTDKPVEFVFSLTAKDNEKLNDIVRKKVSIEQFGFWETDSVVYLGDQSYNAHIDDDARNDKTTVELTVSSTTMSSFTGAMNYLIHYPYGCMEQTTSAFMPAVLAKENPEFFREALKGKNIDDIIAVGVKRLSQKQNSDGGWSWWGGNSNLFLSTYVAEYLLRAQAQGASIDDSVIAKASKYFNQKKTKDETEQIMIAYGKSLFGNGDGQIIHPASSMDSDIVAMSVIANVRNGFTDKNTNGYNLLLAKLQSHGNVSYWPASARERFGSVDASSGIGLRALLMADGDTHIASQVVQHFLTTRKKEYWTNTFATAQILEGFVNYEKYEAQNSQNYTVQIFVDDNLLTSKTFDANNTLETVKIPNNIIAKSSPVITIKPDKQNVTLYSTLLTRQYHTSTSAKPIARTISIERTYKNIKGDKYSIGIGDTVVVDFVVKGLKRGDRYFMIEDKLPAGMVPLNEHLNNVSSENDNSSYISKEYTKSGVIISDNRIERDGDRHYHYKARVVAGGDYSVPPASAMLMYNPEIYANSGSKIMHIENVSQIVDIEGEKSNKNKNNIFANVPIRAIAIGIVGIIVLMVTSIVLIYHKKS